MKKLILMTILFSFAASAFAGKMTLREKKEYKAWTETIEKEMKNVNKKCGTKIKVELDKKFTAPFITESAHAGYYCLNFATAVRQVCQTDDLSKGAIKESVKKIKCVYDNEKDKEKSKNPKFKLKSGTFEVKFGRNATNMPAKAKKFLENNL